DRRFFEGRQRATRGEASLRGFDWFACDQASAEQHERSESRATDQRAHSYEAADCAGPSLYRGYAGYEQSGRLFSPAVTVTDIPGALPFSTQSNSRPAWSKRFGIGAAGTVRPFPVLP